VDGTSNVSVLQLRTATPSANTQAVVFTSIDLTKATYSASYNGASVAAAATDAFVITGSATKTVRVMRVQATGTQTTAGLVPMNLVKRSTADSSGTTTVVTPVPHDSVSAAATATVTVYSGNPTVGNPLANTMVSSKVLVPAPASVVTSDVDGFLFEARRPAQAIVLRGTAQQLALNFSGATLVGASMNYGIEWTEE
jgi:hypothetical protein